MFAKGNESWKARKSNKGGRPRKYKAKAQAQEPEPAVIETSCETVANDGVEANDVVEAVGEQPGNDDVVDTGPGGDGLVAIDESVDEGGLGYVRHITNPKKRAMLAAYAEVGSLTGAAKASGYSMSAHYVWMESDPHYELAYRVAKHMFSERLIEAVHERALRADKPSDLMTIFALKGLRNEYRDNVAAQQLNVALGPQSLAIIHSNAEGKREFDFDAFRQLLKP